MSEVTKFSFWGCIIYDRSWKSFFFWEVSLKVQDLDLKSFWYWFRFVGTICRSQALQDRRWPDLICFSRLTKTLSLFTMVRVANWIPLNPTSTEFRSEFLWYTSSKRLSKLCLQKKKYGCGLQTSFSLLNSKLLWLHVVCFLSPETSLPQAYSSLAIS